MRPTSEEQVPEDVVPALPAEVEPEELGDRRWKESMVAALRLTWRRRRFVLRIAFAGMILGGIYAFLIPKRYQTIVRLMPPDNNMNPYALALASGGMGRVGASMPGLAADLLGLKTTGAVFIGILHSRTLQDRLIERFSLRSVYGVPLMQDARRVLDDNTDVSEDRKSGIIVITVTDTNPQRAQALGEAYIEELNRLVSQLSTSGARREREFIETRLKTVKEDLEAAEKALGEFSSKNATLDVREQGRAMVEAAATLEGNLIAAESELKMLQEIYTDQNVRVRSAQARVNELRQQLNKLGGSGASAGGDTNSSMEGGYPTLRQLPLIGTTYADLYRRVKIQETVFEALSQQYELAKVQEAKEIPTVKVLDPPAVPERKSYPPRLLLTVASGLVAFFVAVALVLGGARWEQVDPLDPGKAFVQEIVAAVRAEARHITENGHGQRFLKEGILGRFKLVRRNGTPTNGEKTEEREKSL